MAKEEKLRMVKKGEGGGVPTPVSKLDDTELSSLSTVVIIKFLQMGLKIEI